MPSDPSIWLAIVSLALFSTALAYIIYFRILLTAGATNVLLVTLLIPVSAILLGTAILGEKLTWLKVLGAITVITGMAMMNTK